MSDIKQAKRAVDWTIEQIERAEDVLRVVRELIDEDRRKLDRANFKQAFTLAVLDVARLEVQAAEKELVSAYLEAHTSKTVPVSKRTTETVQRFRSLGPTRLRRFLAWQEVERAVAHEEPDATVSSTLT